MVLILRRNIDIFERYTEQQENNAFIGKMGLTVKNFHRIPNIQLLEEVALK